MTPTKFNYKDLLDLGFKRKEMSDEIFFNRYGFNWFLFRYKLDKRIWLEWDCNSREVRMVCYSKKGVIKNKSYMRTIEEITRLIFIYTGNDRN